MMKSRWLWASSGLGGVLLAGMAGASETKTFTYDALGRLTGSTIAGGPNNTRQIETCFDRAGNRLRYDVATSAPAACPTPAPTSVATPTPTPTPMPTPTQTPTPTPTNSPPITVTDSLSLACGTTADINVVANDHDPEGNNPLALVSVDAGGGGFSVSMLNSTTVEVSSTASGSVTVHHVVRDSLGATSTGTLNITGTGTCTDEPLG